MTILTNLPSTMTSRTICIFSRCRATFGSALAAASTASLSASLGTVTSPRRFPLTYTACPAPTVPNRVSANPFRKTVALGPFIGLGHCASLPRLKRVDTTGWSSSGLQVYRWAECKFALRIKVPLFVADYVNPGLNGSGNPYFSQPGAKAIRKDSETGLAILDRLAYEVESHHSNLGNSQAVQESLFPLGEAF